MELKEEIKLLKEKVELLEKVRELQDIIKANEEVDVPVVPYIPNSYPTTPYPSYPYPFPYPWYWTTSEMIRSY